MPASPSTGKQTIPKTKQIQKEIMLPTQTKLLLGAKTQCLGQVPILAAHFKVRTARFRGDRF
jgi:hypothetical protein